MSRAPVKPSMALWFAVVRLQQRIGITGLIGLGLLAVAVVSSGLAWNQHRVFQHENFSGNGVVPSDGVSSSMAPSSVSDSQPAPVRWPSAKDIPLLLSRIERAAVERGLGWPQADYRFIPATATTPDSLEVRCALKGSYRSIRGFVTTLLMDQPTLTLREFSVRRGDADTANVDAKLAIVVFLGPMAGAHSGAAR